MKLHLLSFLLLTSITFSCKSPHYNAENWPHTYLSTGSFGGFSGLVSTTFVLPNGQVFAENSMEKKKLELKKLSKKEAKNLLKSAEKMQWNKLPPDNFGNMSYFISYHTKDTTYTANWGANGSSPPAAVEQIYQQIQKLIVQ